MTEPEDRPETADTTRPGDADAARRAGRPPVWLIAGTAVVALLLTGGALVGGFLLTRDESRSDTARSVEREIAVYFCTRTSSTPGCRGRDATDAERQAVTQRVQEMKQVRHIEYETKQEAYERFKKVFKNRKDMLESVRAGDVSDSLRLRVTDTEGAKAVQAALEGIAGVDSVVIQPLAPET